MLRIVFQNLSFVNGFNNLIKRDVLLNHFLLGMLSDTNVLYINLSTHPLQHRLEISNIHFVHAITSHNYSLSEETKGISVNTE